MKKLRLICFILCWFVFSGALTAQNVTVTGTVTDGTNGDPIAYATVSVQGTTIGTATDERGVYSVTVPRDRTLTFSFVGYKTAQEAVGDRVRIDVALQPDVTVMDEVIVVAYGTATRASFTGSASVVSADQLETRALTNLASGFEGNSPGIQVTAAHGQPGESASIRIRGFGSYGATNSPLYVVDGATFNGDLSSINPSDIASMTILKDAQSTALYGSSAGNGVILITTKKGTSNKGSISFSVSQGISQRAYKDYAAVDIWDYYPLQWEMLKNSLITGGRSAEEAAQIASYGLETEKEQIESIGAKLRYNPFKGVSEDGIVDTNGNLIPTELKWADDLDWSKAAYRKGHRQEYNMSYNSRTDNSDTYASVGYLKETGYMINTDFERYTGRINYNMNPTTWFKTGINLALTRALHNNSTSTSDSSSSYGNLTRFVRQMAPIYPIHVHDMETGAYLDANGDPTTDPSKYVYDTDGPRLSNGGRHAIAEQLWNERLYTTNTNTGRVYATVMPIDGLEITANYGVDTRENRRTVYRNAIVGDGSPGGDQYKYSYRTTTETFSQLVNYRKQLDEHNFLITAGHESYSYKYEALYGSKKNQTVSGIHEFPNFVDINSLQSYTNNYTKEGYFARLNYDYASKYYASASFRRDGTSRFSKDNRWGNFWSFGGSWRISEEEFMRSVGWVDNLKLRASYGETGVDRIVDSDGSQVYFPYLSQYELGANNGNESGFFFSTLANRDLKWETQASTDVALEFTIFGRLTGTVEYFQKDSKDLIFNVSIPGSNGVKTTSQNIGKIRNSGVEIDLNYRILNRPDWKLDFGANMTYLKNKIISLPPENRAEGIISGSKKLVEGGSIYQFWLRQWWGVNPANGDGLFLLNTDLLETSNESTLAAIEKTRVEIDGQQLTSNNSYAKYDYSKNANPNVYGGFHITLGWKNFSLNTTFSYQLGGKILDSTYASMMSMSKYGLSMHADTKKAWREPGDMTSVPRLDATASYATDVDASNSTRWLTSSDYLNMRTISLTYNLPKTLIQKFDISSARITLNAENLFMLKARQGLNPMANFSGTTYNEYMPARIFSASLNLTF